MMIINTNTPLINEPASPVKKQRSSKRVSFNEMAQVFVLESKYDDIEDSDLYYQRKDYKSFKKSMLAAVKRRLLPEDSPKYAKYADADVECRGLERLVDPVAHKQLCLSATLAVLEEQSRLNVDGEKNTDIAIAEAYSAYTRHSRRLAKRLAMFDAKQARNVYLSACA